MVWGSMVNQTALLGHQHVLFMVASLVKMRITPCCVQRVGNTEIKLHSVTDVIKLLLFPVMHTPSRLSVRGSCETSSQNVVKQVQYSGILSV